MTEQNREERTGKRKNATLTVQLEDVGFEQLNQIEAVLKREFKRKRITRSEVVRMAIRGYYQFVCVGILPEIKEG